jgi:hypothetical protein
MATLTCGRKFPRLLGDSALDSLGERALLCDMSSSLFRHITTRAPALQAASLLSVNRMLDESVYASVVQRLAISCELSRCRQVR